jgi:hypothetical protein
LIAAQRATKRVPKQLKGPPFPDVGVGIWETFCQISRQRSGQNITLTDIASWCFLNSRRFARWELEALMRLEAARNRPNDHSQDET